MEGISKKEIEIISRLEFDRRYFFKAGDIDQHVKNKTQRYNMIKNLLKKKRIIKINRKKYYLIPIKAKSGSWAEHPFVIIDEVCDGKDYFIGGWSAANYWRFTDQIPFTHSVFTTRRQGEFRILNTRIFFHRTTSQRIEKESTSRKVENHTFKILKKKESEKWMKSRG